jgi:rod shape determining protein RodA
MIDRRLIKHIDWSLLLLTLMLLIISFILLYSASFQSSENYYHKQLIWLTIASILFFLFISIPYNWLLELSPILYSFSLIGLIAVLFIGHKVSGSKSWLRISWVSLQPSEFAKIATILLLAYYLGKKEMKELSIKHFFIVLIIVAIPMLLILKQPDLGTALTFGAILFFMLYSAGFSLKILISLASLTIASLPIAYLFLKPYQKERFIAFLNPTSDPLGSGYQLIQSKVAIGSGGIAGKGFLNGSQTHLDFIPAKHTDFILSILGEEWGFIGIFILLIIYAIFILKCLQNAKEAKDKQGALIIIGVMSLIIFQAIINIGMVIGSLPITGLPLPLISYGGSSLFISLISVALIINVSMRRFYYIE